MCITEKIHFQDMDDLQLNDVADDGIHIAAIAAYVAAWAPIHQGSKGKKKKGAVWATNPGLRQQIGYPTNAVGPVEHNRPKDNVKEVAKAFNRTLADEGFLSASVAVAGYTAISCSLLDLQSAVCLFTVMR